MEQTLSQKLKATREAKGITLADASHATRIPMARLQLLEAANYAAFGNMAYARSFIRLYSNYLGVNAESVINELPSPVLGGRADYRYLTESFGPWVHNRAEQRPGPMRIDQKSRTRTVSALAMFLVLFVATFSVLKAGLLSPQAKLTTADSKDAPVTLMQPSNSPGIPVASPGPQELIQGKHVAVSKAVPAQSY
jgi:cytoskeletal protein RodZ